MKWIGQHIVDFIARFRSDVHLEGVAESAQDHVVGIDADGKLYKQDVSVGDITAVTITTDSGGGAVASDTSGSADFSILGATGVGVTNSGTTITATAVPGEIDHDSLQNFVAEEHVDWAGSSTGTIHSSNVPTLNQNTTGSAATLTTPRAINGVNFDGSAPITVTAAGSTLSDTVTVAKGGTGATSFTSNALLTGNTTSAIQAEANLTFSSDTLALTSTTESKPILSTTNSHDSANSSELLFVKNRTGDILGAGGDDVGKVTFQGTNAKAGGTEDIDYAQILSEISSPTDGAEMGKVSVTVAKSGSLVNVLNSYAQASGVITTFGDGGLLGSNAFNTAITSFNSTTSTAPIMTIVNGANDATGPSFTFYNSRGGTGPGGAANQNGDDLGTIKWQGYDSGAVSTTFAQMLGEANEVTAGSEEGKLTLSVASHDAEMQPGLTIVSGDAEDEVDVTIGNGATSIVTVPGNISIGGHSINDIDVAGEFVDSDEHLMTSAAIDDRIAAAGGGGGGTSYWHQVVPGYKTNWNSASNYYTFYRGWYENWSNSDSSPGTVSYTDYYAHIFVAPRAGTITNVKISGTVTGATYDDPFKFYFYKTGSSSNQSSVTLTSMFNTSAITPPGNAKTWSHTEDFSSSNTFAEDDRIFVWIKKDSTAGATSCYWTINVNGEYS